ncbi:hypothetical protein PUNSTDRAFT_146706 [Punctularia strigosozonata HHB-11173 SS5]|uniref:F-box domain-containing protein n=1 Tax=Punctularia strigosozonata (strain HHB-11173) TaxID=741275 RepID=R7S0K0_PUNST|nr:uncharacterized protein PUNSTDRAFT_146706 [Punctularia strigosozonata HHB-11173 SS5]EIN03925.1 hypothetical protein PUNSTDRAFT_146706 [Punctularia strigosozonata HHB-11173 SS5]
MALCCKTVYDMSIPALCSSVVLRTPLQLNAFCEFMTLHPLCIPYVHHLRLRTSLTMQWMKGPMATLVAISFGADLLADVLARADNLTTLAIEHADRVLNESLELIAALRSRPRLLNLTLTHAGPRALDLVSGLRTVQRLDLHRQPQVDVRAPPVRASAYLAPIAPTLRTLVLSTPTHSDEREFDGVLCPALSELQLTTRSAVLERWFAPFPAVRRLTIRADWSVVDAFPAAWSSLPWTILDRLVGNIQGLCSLGIACEVRFIGIDPPPVTGGHPDPFGDPAYEAMFMELLSRTRPTALALGYSSLRASSNTRVFALLADTQHQLRFLDVSVLSRDWLELMASLDKAPAEQPVKDHSWLLRFVAKEVAAAKYIEMSCPPARISRGWYRITRKGADPPLLETLSEAHGLALRKQWTYPSTP